VPKTAVCIDDRALEPTWESDPAVGRLVSAAKSAAGLNILILFGQDPLACDTPQGFAMRLRYPVDQVQDALESLHAGGVLSVSEGQASGPRACYWLPAGGGLPTAVRRLFEAYMTGPRERGALVRAVGPQRVPA